MNAASATRSLSSHNPQYTDHKAALPSPLNEDKKFQGHAIAYRPDIDGLRAVAVLVVIIYHLFPALLPGGFIGVDIFFVISGYLISSIIFKEINAQTFSFFDFYIRRIKRIFPTLLIVLGCVSLIGWVICIPTEYQSLGVTMKGAATFTANHRLLANINYFTPAASQNPLLHLWSLSVEEQFYIFFPIVIFYLFKKKELLLPITILVFAASFLLNILFIDAKSSEVFYLLPYRAWELLAGTILAYGSMRQQLHSMPIVDKLSSYVKEAFIKGVFFQNFAAYSALALLLGSALFLTDSHAFPGWFALLPVVIGCLFILSKGSWLNASILSNKIAVGIGKMSYSLYLWHWPLFSFCQIYYHGQADLVTRIGVLLASFILSALTTFLIDLPTRRSKPTVAYYLSGAMLVVYLYSSVISKNDLPTLSFLSTPEMEKIYTSMASWDYPSKNLTRTNNPNLPFHSFGKGEKIIVFFGDSNLEQYWPRVEKILLSDPYLYHKYTVVFATCSGQIPLFGEQKNIRAEQFLKKAENFLLHNTQIEKIVFGAQWFGYFNTHAETSKRLYEKLSKTLCQMSEAGKKVYLILNIPIENKQDPSNLFERKIFGRWKVKNSSPYDANEWLSQSTEITQTLKKIAKTGRAIIINPYNTLCPNDTCTILDHEGYPIYKDSCHLTSRFAGEQALFIDRILKDE